MRPPLSFDDITPLLQNITDAIAEVALELDTVLGRGAAGAAHALQLLRQLLEERCIARQAVDERHRLAAAPLFLHAQLGDDACRHRFVTSNRAAALAIAFGPAASGTDASGGGRVDRSGVGPVRHRVSLTRRLEQAEAREGANRGHRGYFAQRCTENRGKRPSDAQGREITEAVGRATRGHVPAAGRRPTAGRGTLFSVRLCAK